jgi:hypothetical protein
LVKPDVADFELGGVDADCQPARPSIDIVAGERALATLIELPLCRQGERLRRDHRATAQHIENRRWNCGAVERHL